MFGFFSFAIYTLNIKIFICILHYYIQIVQINRDLSGAVDARAKERENRWKKAKRKNAKFCDMTNAHAHFAMN